QLPKNGQVPPDETPIVKNDIETWVSGEFQPTIDDSLPFGAIRRLRLIHGGVEAPIDLTVRPVDPQNPPAFLQTIAWDGIPLASPYFITADRRLTISPGNRADVLVSVPGVPGVEYPDKLEYVVIHRGDQTTPDTPELILARFLVDPGKPVERAKFVSQKAAENIFRTCTPNLNSSNSPNTEAFNIAFADSSFGPDGSFTHGTFTLNNQPFPGDSKIFTLNHSQKLSFAVTGGDAPHPLHIHVNPFLVPADDTRGILGLPTCQYWADTYLIQAGQSVNMLMPFNHWTGDFVGHCHILDHEDAGMMDLLRIRPDVFSWPDFPIYKMLNQPTIPKGSFDKLTVSWPANTRIPVATSDASKVSVYFFMPAAKDGTACPHCADSVKAVAKLRQTIKNPDSVRIVVITATSGDAIPSAESLGLIANHDLLCSDPDLYAFESIGLIDGTPQIKGGDLRFPRSFIGNSRKPKVESDVMHGLFIVDRNGMLVSARYAFSAFDDTTQIIHEIELAQKGNDAIQVAYQQSEGPNDTASRRRAGARHKAYDTRLKAFNSSK
ncbi:MAG: multicopper oxidase domain-containing protein, partial [Schlesneria sp.]